MIWLNGWNWFWIERTDGYIVVVQQIERLIGRWNIALQLALLILDSFQLFYDCYERLINDMKWSSFAYVIDFEEWSMKMMKIEESNKNAATCRTRQIFTQIQPPCARYDFAFSSFCLLQLLVTVTLTDAVFLSTSNIRWTQCSIHA